MGIFNKKKQQPAAPKTASNAEQYIVRKGNTINVDASINKIIESFEKNPTHKKLADGYLSTHKDANAKRNLAFYIFSQLPIHDPVDVAFYKKSHGLTDKTIYAINGQSNSPITEALAKKEADPKYGAKIVKFASKVDRVATIATAAAIGTGVGFALAPLIPGVLIVGGSSTALSSITTGFLTASGGGIALATGTGQNKTDHHSREEYTELNGRIPALSKLALWGVKKYEAHKNKKYDNQVTERLEAAFKDEKKGKEINNHIQKFTGNEADTKIVRDLIANFLLDSPISKEVQNTLSTMANAFRIPVNR